MNGTNSRYIKDIINYFKMPGLQITELYDKPDSIKQYIDKHLEPMINNFKRKPRFIIKITILLKFLFYLLVH